MRYRSDTGAAWHQLGLLEELDWRDHFFITAELIGRPCCSVVSRSATSARAAM
jgi:hypothetical protein